MVDTEIALDDCLTLLSISRHGGQAGKPSEVVSTRVSLGGYLEGLQPENIIL